ncbi:MAG: RHS repeat-associated core domain-containing protein [Luteibacter jiangsuensis]
METIYSAYGGTHGQAGQARSRYTGERIETHPGWYLLGTRPYDPALRRFLAPDAMSPFDAGGVNRYTYCGGDPINRVDPSGHVWENPWSKLRDPLVAIARSILGMTPTQPGTPATPVITAHTAAASMDVARVSSGIPSGSLVAPAVPGNVVLGQLAPGPGTSRARGSEPPPAKRPRTDELLPASGVLRDMERPRISDRVGRWTKYALTANTGSRSIWVTDEALDETGATDLVRNLASSPRRPKNRIRKLWLYTGYEGVRNGRNWDRDFLRTPRAASSGYAELARRFEVPAGESVGINVQIVDMQFAHQELMTQKLKRAGVHVVGISYGLMDPAVRKALNLDVDSVSTS